MSRVDISRDCDATRKFNAQAVLGHLLVFPQPQPPSLLLKPSSSPRYLLASTPPTDVLPLDNTHHFPIPRCKTNDQGHYAIYRWNGSFLRSMYLTPTPSRFYDPESQVTNAPHLLKDCRTAHQPNDVYLPMNEASQHHLDPADYH